MAEQVVWTAMADGTREDYEFLSGIYEEHAREGLADSLFDLLTRMEGPTLGTFHDGTPDADARMRNRRRAGIASSSG